MAEQPWDDTSRNGVDRGLLEAGYNILEGQGIELLVTNPRYVHAVPGRKTDVKDAECIADLLRHGLLRPSFVPNREQRELRELVRYRKSLSQEKVRVVSRIEKILEGGNIKLTSVASHVISQSSRLMLAELIAGNQDTAAMDEQHRRAKALLHQMHRHMRQHSTPPASGRQAANR